jgi:transposase
MAGRPLVIPWQHSAAELQARYRAERDGRVQPRLHALWLLRQGQGLQATATLVGVTYRTVQEWVRWYRTGGVEEVRRHQRGGLRRTIREPLSDEQQRALLEHARTAGFATIPSAIAWLAEEHGVQLPWHQMVRQFRRLQLRAKRPRPISDRADPAAQAAWKKGGSPRPSPPPG